MALPFLFGKIGVYLVELRVNHLIQLKRLLMAVLTI